MNCPFPLRSYCIVAAALIFIMGCSNGDTGNKIPRETPTSGTIHISCDESFKPVMESEVKVFESSFPNAKLIIDYKPEAECFRDLAGDSTRMIIVTRGLNKEEEKFYLDSIHFVPIYGKLAYDAIAVVVNNQAKDSLFSMDELSALLKGQSELKLQPVMDGVSATSTVRYAIDSITRGAPLGKNVLAAKSSEGVIDYVSKNPDAIGFIGVGWIGNPEDPDQTEFLKKVKVASIECEACPNNPYVKPYQGNIAGKRYPMIRGLYYILKEDFKGVGNNFVNFLQFERGQLIFRRAYLMPSRMSFELRNMQITN